MIPRPPDLTDKQWLMRCFMAMATAVQTGNPDLVGVSQATLNEFVKTLPENWRPAKEPSE